MVTIYNILLLTIAVLCFPVLLVLSLISRKRRKTVCHRMGFSSLPNGLRSLKPLWLHALSVGEVNAVIPLLGRIRASFPDQSIVLSVSTFKGYEVATQRIGNQIERIFYFPYDFLFTVKSMVSRINPSLVLIVETDIWPNFLFEMNRRNIPVVLVNARFSDKSLSGYLKLLFFMKPVFRCFSKICVQSKADIGRYAQLGIPLEKITCTGNIKYDQVRDTDTDQNENNLRLELNLAPSDRVFLAGSTHSGEEKILLDVYTRLKTEWPSLILIDVPRDPARAKQVCKDFQSAGLSAACQTELGQIANRAIRLDVIVVDTIGALRSMYRVADVAFVGGSLVNSGGHNPLEPAAYGKPILFGPDMSDFKEISKNLLSSKGAVRVRDGDDLYQQARRLLNNDGAAQEMGRNAYAVLDSNKGAVENTMSVIMDVIR